MKRTIASAFVLVGVIAPATAAITLTDGNSLVEIDETSQAGMGTWMVDGVDHLFQQWYWIRINQSPEVSVDAIGAPNVTLYGSNIAVVSYSNALVQVDMTFVLTGGTPGSNTSDIAESIRVINRTDRAFHLSLFEYDDFDLDGTAGGDRAEAFGAPVTTITQWDSSRVFVGAVPPVTHWEIASFPSILDRLNDANPDNLLDTGSPFGPGDATFAMQWDTQLAPGGAFIISKDKLIVPEPTTIAAIGFGLAALAARRRRK